MNGQITIREIHSSRSQDCWPVMAQLRPHLALSGFVIMASRMAAADGYRLVAADVEGQIVGVAGFRKLEMLYCGRILSIDDLVVAEAMRSAGVGSTLLEWLDAEARRLECTQVHLDSGLQRLEAHRFYDREGFARTAYHFARSV